MDAYAFRRLEGAAIDYDTGKETGGFLLDRADAAFAALY
jgi:Fe-S cluster assembly iron-binding protein IscA